MSSPTVDQLRQEVLELTALLRGSPDWHDLRTALTARGLDPDAVLLVSFSEDEQGGEYGLVLTRACGFFEYVRNTNSRAPLEFASWTTLAFDESLREAYPMAEHALKLLDRVA